MFTWPHPLSWGCTWGGRMTVFRGSSARTRSPSVQGRSAKCWRSWWRKPERTKVNKALKFFELKFCKRKSKKWFSKICSKDWQTFILAIDLNYQFGLNCDVSLNNLQNSFDQVHLTRFLLSEYQCIFGSYLLYFHFSK